MTNKQAYEKLNDGKRDLTIKDMTDNLSAIEYFNKRLPEDRERYKSDPYFSKMLYEQTKRYASLKPLYEKALEYLQNKVMV